MDKVQNISLGGFSFVIEEQAFNQLTKYINQIKIYLGHSQDAQEIIYDIEQRMAELLKERLHGREVIISSDVDFLEQTMGSAEQYNIDQEQQEPNSQQNQDPKKPFAGKKLFRDPDNKKVAGVLSGLSYYFNTDPSIMRIIFCTLLILSFVLLGNSDNPVGMLTISFLYFALWFCIPVADTPSKKLQMKGEDININTISNLKNEPNYMSSNKKILTRDMNSKVIAGVLAGLAKYFNWTLNIVWIRLITLCAVLGLIPLTNGISSLVFFVYIFLWITLPKEYSPQNPQNDNTDGNISQQNNASATIIVNNNHSFLSKMLKAFAIFVLGIIIISFLGSIVAIFVGIGAFLFQFDVDYFSAHDFLPFLFDYTWQTALTYVAFISLLLLFFYIIVWFFLKISNSKILNHKAWTISSITLISVTIISAVSVLTTAVSSFKADERVSQDIPLNITSDTIFIKNASGYPTYNNTFLTGISDDKQKILWDDVYVNIRETEPNQAPYITITKESKGSSKRNAIKNAENIKFPITIEGNNIFIPPYIIIDKNSKFRFQSVNVDIYLPKNVKFNFDKRINFSNFISDERKQELMNKYDLSEEDVQDIKDAVKEVKDEIKDAIKEIKDDLSE